MTHPFHAVLVWTLMNDEVAAAKIVEWRRRSGGPLERRRLPGIVRRERAPPSRMNQVVKKNELGGAREESCDRDEFVDRDQRDQVIVDETRNSGGRCRRGPDSASA